MTYTSDKPANAESSEQLRARIPGWGSDLDPNDRPSVPRERFDPDATNAHWDIPEQQAEKWPRERSIEHGRLTPVFGTAQPPHGLAGKVRRYAYARFSEGRLAHWLLLIVADRIDATEARLRTYASTRPDNLLTETGVLSERRRHGISSRAGRVDVRHQWLDPIIAAGPALLRGYLAYRLVRRVVRSRRTQARTSEP
jgi:hypothetical protein